MYIKMTYNDYLRGTIKKPVKHSFKMDADRLQDFLCNLGQCYGTLIDATDYIDASCFMSIAKSGDTYTARDFSFTVL